MKPSLTNLLRYKDILCYRTLAQLKAESKNNYLGYVWFILEPLISTAILYLVFGVIMGNRGSDMVLFILIGMMIWQWFEGSIMTGTHGISEKSRILNVVNVPKFIFPMVYVLANTWKFAWVYLIMVVLAQILGYTANWGYLWLPLVLGVQLFLILGLTLPLAVAVAYMPDFTTMISSVFRLLFFLSGIFFSADRVPEDLLFYYNLNPITLLMNANRDILLHGQMPDLSGLLYCLGFGAVAMTIGILWCLKIDKKIMKAIPA